MKCRILILANNVENTNAYLAYFGIYLLCFGLFCTKNLPSQLVTAKLSRTTTAVHHFGGMF
jgi:hypothetical protein